MKSRRTNDLLSAVWRRDGDQWDWPEVWPRGDADFPEAGRRPARLCISWARRSDRTFSAPSPGQFRRWRGGDWCSRVAL